MRQKRIAVINDFSGFGRCSVAVALPVISAMKVQCCVVPTSIFSNHTGFPSFFFDDYTDRMQAYISEWKKLAITFNGIATGFLGSKRQIEIVSEFIGDFRSAETVVLVDPVMGDGGKPYQTYTQEMCEEMKGLAALADILTPNLTEACLLTRTPYREKFSQAELRQMARTLALMGPKKIVITGISQGSYIANYCYQEGEEPCMIRTVKVGCGRPGTGDLFASIIAADAVRQVPFDKSVRKASGFVKKCILKSMELEVPVLEGVCFEELLDQLK